MEPNSSSAGTPAAKSPPDAFEVGMKLDEMERRLIEVTLEHFAGHRAKAAQALGIGIRTLTNKLRLYGYAPRAKSFNREI
jgi:DNA-binding NtrC family response regulator